MIESRANKAHIKSVAVSHLGGRREGRGGELTGRERVGERLAANNGKIAQR